MYDKLKFPDRDINYEKNYLYYVYLTNYEGIFVIEPYSTNITKYMKYYTIDEAVNSSSKLNNLFDNYSKDEDLIGMDMIRKFVQYVMSQCQSYYKKNIKKIMGDVKTELLANRKMLDIYDVFENLLNKIKDDKKYVSWVISQNYMLSDPYKPENYILDNSLYKQFTSLQ